MFSEECRRHNKAPETPSRRPIGNLVIHEHRHGVTGEFSTKDWGHALSADCANLVEDAKVRAPHQTRVADRLLPPEPVDRPDKVMPLPVGSFETAA